MKKNKQVEKVTMDLAGFLRDITGDESWAYTDGPDSGMGVDYWFSNDDGQTGYINIDQYSMTVSVDDEVIYEGNAEKAEVA